MFEILENQSVISVSGSGAGKFLQSLTTNDIINNTYSHNYLLNNQGRYLFDFFIHTNEDNTFLLEINSARTEDLIKRFNLYKLRSDVHITNCSQTHKVIYSREPLEIDYIKSNQDPRYKKLGFRSIIELEKINRLGRIANNLYFNDKYKYALPDGDIDLIFEKSIPVEYGAEELNSISYSKGCYIGQEVISRAKYQGVVRKKIYHVSSGDSNINAQSGVDVVDLLGNKIGILCSSYIKQGIALLREELVLALTEKVAMINEVKVDINVPGWRK
jgi:hypothetical protein